MTHLWEIEHPYYCEEGNWFKTGQHTQFDDWAEFTETFFYCGDRDQNLLIRWDWRKPGHSEFTDDAEYLQMHFVLQRKAWLCSVRIPVSEVDEPAVRAFLESCARTMAATWEPVALTVAEVSR